MASNDIENLIEKGRWKQAQRVIEKQLNKEPDDHWLLSRLSGVKYEQGDYRGALEDAKRALKIVPDCPLAMWNYAGALDMLGKTRKAGKVYLQITSRGIEELEKPDEDANECWEGANWTRGIVVDSFFRLAGCLAKLGKREEAADLYRQFIIFIEEDRWQGIYSREDAVARLRKLKLGKAAILDGMGKRVKKLEKVMA